VSIFKSILKRALKNTATLERLAGLSNRQTVYSQFGEDAHIASYYNRLAVDRGIVVVRGCIVDVGAYRPISLSNTYGFYKRGWRSINIDPTPGTKAMFDRVRPTDTNLELAISCKSGQGTFYVFGVPSVWNTMDPDAARLAEAKSGIVPRKVAVEICRLDTVLDRHLKGDNFELLSIDAEGYDIEILQSNNFSKFLPRLIMIEVHNVSLDTLKDHEIVRHLGTYGYTLYSWINPNLLFVRADSFLKWTPSVGPLNPIC